MTFVLSVSCSVSHVSAPSLVLSSARDSSRSVSGFTHHRNYSKNFDDNRKRGEGCGCVVKSENEYLDLSKIYNVFNATDYFE